MMHKEFAILCLCLFGQVACSTSEQLALEQPGYKHMPQGFVYVDQVVPDIVTDLKYSGTDNFIGRPLAGYKGRRAILRIETALALKQVDADLQQQGYRLIIYDAYRPHTAMMDISRWRQDLTDQRQKDKFYPNIDKQRIFADKYLHDFSEHSRGTALDVGLLYAKTGRPVDMGGHHDLLDPSSATASKQVSGNQYKNRQILKQTFERHGFVNYASEWWHYLLRNEPDPRAHFYFPVTDNMLP